MNPKIVKKIKSKLPLNDSEFLELLGDFLMFDLKPGYNRAILYLDGKTWGTDVEYRAGAISWKPQALKEYIKRETIVTYWEEI
jgi:hypothetical protein